ncbi:MAG TPA: hypothetical protein VNO30_37835 [Kofleriaceae bacterium]|nr:hypothetical protein [Kofleriaceae bacterium]
MPRLALVGLLALLAMSACRLSLEDEDDGGDDMPMPGGRLCVEVPTNAACAEAKTLSTVPLSWIEQNVFTPNCGGGSCHGTPTGGGAPLGRIVLTSMSRDKLVNVDATFATSRKLIVPSDVPKSYLMVIMKHTKLEDADPPAPEPSGGRYMPLGSPAVCCEKLDAIASWITAGAPP